VGVAAQFGRVKVNKPDALTVHLDRGAVLNTNLSRRQA
jgi:hypothetical protein